MVISLRFKRFLKAIVIIIAIYYAVIIFTPLSRWLADKLVVPSVVTKADVIIVLSGGTIKQQYLHHHTVNRLLHGITIWRQGNAPNLIFCGGPPATGGVPEAYLMADMAQKLGVSSNAIVLDNQSLNTRENMVNAGLLMKKQGWKRALLVTSAMHMKRAMKLAKEEGLDCLPSAAPYSERYMSHYQLYRLVKHEYFALMVDKVLGKRGFKILSDFNRWLHRVKDKIFHY